MTLSLDSLLRPLTIGSFLHEVWDRAPWVGAARFGRTTAEELLSLGSLEQVLSSIYRPGDSWLQLAQGGSYAVPDHMLGADGLLNLRELYGAFAQGRTIYLTKAERLVASLGQLSRSVELELGAAGLAVRQPLDAHVFLTPAQSQGFAPHRDDHASLVLQLEGAKDWTVYDRSTERGGSPEGQCSAGPADPRALGATAHSFHLEAGDVLYVPELWIHEARALEQHSLHVTLRIFSWRWSDVLRGLIDRHPALAAPVPAGAALDVAELAAGLQAVLGAEPFQRGLGRSLPQLQREQLMPRRVLPEDGLRQVVASSQLSAESWLVHRRGTACQVFLEGDRAHLTFPGGMARGPAVMLAVFRHIAAHRRLRACDLPALAPNVDYDRLEVVRALVRDGLLRLELEALDPSNGRAEP